MSTKNIVAIFIAIAMGVWLLSGEMGSNLANAAEDDQTPSAGEQTPFVRGIESVAANVIEVDIHTVWARFIDGL